MGLCDGKLQCPILFQEGGEEKEWKCVFLLPRHSEVTDRSLYTYNTYLLTFTS